MKPRTAALAFAGVGLAVCVAAGQPAKADNAVAGYTGWAKSSVAGCPYLAWRLAKHDDGTVTGIAYYLDASGVSIVNGTIDKAGNFQLTLKSGMGNGPVGSAVGKRNADGSATADLTGEGCANARLTVNPTPDIATQYHMGG